VRDFAKVSQQCRQGMIGDCIGYRNENGKLVFVRQMFQGKTAADVTFLAMAMVRIVQSGAFRADQVAAAEGGARPIARVAVELKPNKSHKPLELLKRQNLPWTLRKPR